jgi:hypothetical protein
MLRPVRISGASPFPAGCAAASGVPADKVQYGAEVEPSLAIDPLNPRLVVAAYQQDRIETGASLGDVVSYSRDGGRHFRQVQLRGTSTCEGGPARDVGTDPWLSFAPDGTTYAASQLSDGYTVSRSHDAGRSWVTARASSTPTPLDFDDKDSIVADPVRAGRVYLVWDDLFGPDPINGAVASLRLAASGDGGRGWGRRSTIYQPLPPVYGESGPIIVARPDGELVVLFGSNNQSGAIGLPAQPGGMFAVRSRDGGRHWSSATQFATVPARGSEVRDPGTGACIRTGGDCPNNHLDDGLAAAVEPNGAIDAVWQQDESGSSGAIELSRSTDGGVRWSRPRAIVRRITQTYLPEVAVMPDGTIGVSYAALRPYAAGAQALYADLYLTISRDGARSFSGPVRLAGPWDLRQAPISTTESVGRFLGDYNGMAAFPDGFGVDFAASAPMALYGQSDVFFSRVVLPRAAR